MRRWKDRYQAGEELANKIDSLVLNNEVMVVALARGGVPLGWKIASSLDTNLKVLVVRKLGSPFNNEYGIGALTVGGIVIWEEEVIGHLDIHPDQLKAIELRETKELNRRQQVYGIDSNLGEVKGKKVILVDDGAATGLTMLSAIKAIRTHTPSQVIVALPVCSVYAKQRIMKRLGRNDRLVTLVIVKHLLAVGNWYENFNPVGDDEVVRLINDRLEKRDLKPK